MLNLNNITKRYGEKVIFKNMNIQLKIKMLNLLIIINGIK